MGYRGGGLPLSPLLTPLRVPKVEKAIAMTVAMRVTVVNRAVIVATAAIAATAATRMTKEAMAPPKQ